MQSRFRNFFSAVGLLLSSGTARAQEMVEQPSEYDMAVPNEESLQRPKAIPNQTTRRDLPVMERRNTPLMVTGIVLSAVGTGFVAAGSIALVRMHDGAERCRTEERFACGLSEAVASPLAVFAIANGVVMMPVRAPLAVVGGWNVEKKRTRSALVPAVIVGPQSAQARWFY